MPALEGWQISPYYQPAREVGGDFYEYFELGDSRVSFAVGGATGKGVPAAFVMSATCALLGGVATGSGSPPGEVLARVNEAVLTRIPPNMFVTCFYCVLDPKSGQLVYAKPPTPATISLTAPTRVRRPIFRREACRLG